MRQLFTLILGCIFLWMAACHPKPQPNENNKNARTTTLTEEQLEEDTPMAYENLGFSEAATLSAKGEADVIAFGSCNKHDKKQVLWDDIIAQQPDVWIWLGDAVYGDSDQEEVLREKYDAQDKIPAYQQLKANTEIIGTWDDHDYGINNGGKNFHAKEIAKAAYLDFVDVAANSPTRQRAGIYQSYVVGQGDKQVKIILLDTRTFRDDVALDNKKAYIPDPQADILGEAQWKWLENELINNPAAITIIGNGSQVIPNEHRFEKWANYPKARRRLFKLVSDVRPSGVLLISGDRHHAEFSKVKIPKLKHSLYDFTSSGLTHTRSYPQPEANRYREGKKVDQLNFGIIRIHWDKNPVQLDLEIRGDKGVVYESCSFTVGE